MEAITYVRTSPDRYLHRAEDGSRGAFEAETRAYHKITRTETIVSVEDDAEASFSVGERLLTPLGPREGRVLQRSRKHWAARKPVQLSVSWLPLDITSLDERFSQEDPGPGGIYSRLADVGHAVTRIWEDVRVEWATQEEEEFLQLHDYEPVYHLERLAFDASGRTVEVSKTVRSVWNLVLRYDLPLVA